MKQILRFAQDDKPLRAFEKKEGKKVLDPLIPFFSLSRKQANLSS
jgi:hypothetical protein